MDASFRQKAVLLLCVFLAVWLGAKYFLSVVFPFLAGGAVALAAEPAVRFAQRRLKLGRTLSAGLGVSATLLFLMALLSIAGAAVVKEVAQLANAAPKLESTARQGITVLRDFLMDTARRAPEGMRPMLTKSVTDLFSDGTAVMEQVGKRIPGVLTAALSWVPDGVFGLGTGVIAAYLISSRLPKLRTGLARKLPQRWQQYLPALRKMRRALGLWLWAQGKLALVTYGIVGLGLLILGVPGGLGWAALVALVDAVPLLGTGTVLVPWSLICFLQGDQFRAVGLLVIYAAAAVTRTVLEPRVLGRQLGLDPLVTLLCMYAGYRFWGILGLLAAPIVATAVKSALRPDQPEPPPAKA